MTPRAATRRAVPTVAAAVLAAAAGLSLLAVTTAVLRTGARDGVVTLFLITFDLTLVAPLALGAYFTFARRYRDLFMLSAVVVAVVGIGAWFRMTSPAIDFLSGYRADLPPAVGLVAGLFVLLAPFSAAQWFIRRCSRFASTRFKNRG